MFLLRTPKEFVSRMTETDKMTLTPSPQSRFPHPSTPSDVLPSMEPFLYPLLIGDNSSLRVQPDPLPL